MLPVEITPLALQEIKNIKENKGIPAEYSLRIGVRGGGCGASFMIGFDKPKSTDEIYELEGIQILIDKKHFLYLVGVQIDFEETSEGRGFTFVKK
ncbi:MAG: iron-sulfur cluster biosynthesis family protein [Raineya sp.]|nr:iron-sulfur cluster assembly accessory protein [Raineya sp.]MDW8296570.1 iron-sulfur cluster biosynthesis family protein [Raineya sp.]